MAFKGYTILNSRVRDLQDSVDHWSCDKRVMICREKGRTVSNWLSVLALSTAPNLGVEVGGWLQSLPTQSPLQTASEL